MRKALALLAALTLGLITAACGGDDDSSTTAAPRATEQAADHNAADIAFAQGMIPHHTQAIEMAEMALDASLNDQVLSLAKQIQDAQQPEIDQLKGWLSDWGAPLEADDGGGHDAHGGGGDAMGEGMMSTEEMTQLRGMSGAGFDRMWLEMMIRHHEGAIEMAEEHQTDGQNPEALMLGAEIISAQQAEIDEMRALIA